MTQFVNSNVNKLLSILGRGKSIQLRIVFLVCMIVSLSTNLSFVHEINISGYFDVLNDGQASSNMAPIPEWCGLAFHNTNDKHFDFLEMIKQKLSKQIKKRSKNQYFKEDVESVDEDGNMNKIPRDGSISRDNLHPHAGAKDANGNWGYVANVTLLHEWMLKRRSNCTVPKGKNNKGQHIHNDCAHPGYDPEIGKSICGKAPGNGIEEAGWDILKTLQLAKKQPPQHFRRSNDLKVLCAVYTYSARTEHVVTVAETWGWQCDGFFAASNHTEFVPKSSATGAPIEIVNVVHKGPEAYWNMWQKTRSIFGYIHDHYINDFDYFYITGDDTFLIVENLKKFLYEHHQNDNIQLFSGQDFLAFSDIYSINGGGGYVISKVLLKLFVECKLSTCYPNEFISMEDVMLSHCLLQLGVPFTDSTDNEGKQRFHGFYNAKQMANGVYTSAGPMLDTTRNMWSEKHGMKKNGTDYVSTHSISFHRVWSMKRYYALIYKDLCPKSTVLGAALLNDS